MTTQNSGILKSRRKGGGHRAGGTAPNQNPSIHALVGNLSGGNQPQRSCWQSGLLKRRTSLYSMSRRRGDIGAEVKGYTTLPVRFGEEGKAIIMISSSCPELIGMSDNVSL